MKLKLFAMIALFLSSAAHADEGMWLLGNLNKQTQKSMKELGLQMPAKKLYNPKKASLKDAVVSFGGFCSGVVETSLTKGEKENITVKCENNRYTISGTIPKRKDRYRLYLSIARPDSLFITDLQEKFQTAGIEVKNSNLGQLPETTWFHYPSDYLGDIVHSLNVRSDNLYAESVLRLLSLSVHEKGSAEKGIDIIRKYWQNYEADSLELFMYDGSGLARNNKVSAKYLNCVLKETARDSLIGEYFVQTLPLAGKEGSVATFMKHGELPGELRLKSGSMSDVHAYAGYYTTPQNRYAIVVMINNYTCTRAQLKQKISTLLTQVLSKKE